MYENYLVLKPFEELTPLELYKIMFLRIEVFVVEQNCAFQDADNKDQSSWHQMGWRNGELVAYAGIMPPGLAFSQPSIGRVVDFICGSWRGNREQFDGKINRISV